MPDQTVSPSAPSVYSPDFIVALVEQVQRGDQEAMERLYTTLMKGLRSNLSRQLPPDLVEDRAHNVYLITVSAIRAGQIREPARLPAFIRTVTQRQVADAIQGLSRERALALDPLTLPLPDHRENPEQALEQTQRLDCLRAALEALPCRDKEILKRFYLDEQSAETICREMDLSPTQFRLFKSRAKARLGEAGRRRIGPASEPGGRTAAAS